jgi:hypothetical protein
MPIGMLDRLQKEIFHCMKMHEQFDKNNAFWLFVAAYPDHTPKNKSNEDDFQGNGKEMKKLRRYMLGVETQSLCDRIPTQRSVLNHTIECKQVLY